MKPRPAHSMEMPTGETLSSARQLWRIRARLGAVARGVLGLIYPPQCIHCTAAVESPHSLCPACWASMPLIAEPVCARLGTPFQVDYGPDMLSPAAIADPPRFDRARAVALHEGAARALVSRLKFSDRQDLARSMGAMMARVGASLLHDADAVLPVPMHRGRLWQRRFNQSALLARDVAERSGKAFWPDALLRVRRTPPQVGLRREQRRQNLVGAIEANDAYRGHLPGAHLVVIDDVRTTGSTLNACAHILRKAGAARIDVITFTLVKDP